jgi:TrmH family RNA methyltransferase
MAQGREAHPLLAELEQAVSAAGGDVIELPVDILAKVTGKDNPQAVAGVFAEWDTGLDQIDRAAAPLWLVAQAMRDPGNLGTMLRTADAVGAGGLILLDDCVDPFSVEAVRASMGAIFTQGLAQARWDEFLPWLRRAEGQLVAASLRDAVPYRGAAYAAPCFVMVGNDRAACPKTMNWPATCA